MKKIAIIGSGIAGLTCGYHLSHNHDITLFESNSYIGGHTHTVKVRTESEEAEIDTGFIVFNEKTYPSFIALMEEIGVEYQNTEMSFSVRNDGLDLEYNGHTLASLFTQKRNLIRPPFWKMLYEITLFNRDIRNQRGKSQETIGDYLDRKHYSAMFTDNYLLPMISAIWSMGLKSCLDFPLQFFTRFFENHGLLDLRNRPQWFTIKGGSSSYIPPLTHSFNDQIYCSTPVRSLQKVSRGVVVKTDNDEQMFDEAILACHGDQALALLENPSEAEIQILQKFTFSDNHVVLHTDTSLLPKRIGCWASWNYLHVEDAQQKTTLTYNMNILQQLSLNKTYLVSLNQEVNDQHVLGQYTYSHPIYTPGGVEAQLEWRRISGVEKIHFCGAYWFNGFHEDGVRSGMRVCKQLGVI